MKVGEPNGNGQILVCKTSVLSPQYHPRPDHLPKVYIWVMECRKCGFKYGANNCDARGRKCPKCQGGAPSLDIYETLN